MVVKTYEVGMMGNGNYLAYDEETKEAFIVDVTKEVPNIVEDIRNLGLNLKYIILTHGHFDHTGGVQWLRKEFPNAVVVGCKKDNVYFEDRELSHAKGTVHLDKYISDGDILTIGKTEAKVIETPGHSIGSICIYAENVLFSGDTLFQASIGRTDFPTGSFEEIMDSIKNKLFKLPDSTRVLPGHGPETTIAFEKRYNPFV